MPKKIVKNKFASSLEAMKNQKPFPIKNTATGNHHSIDGIGNTNQSPLTQLKLISNQNTGEINNQNLKSEKRSALIQEIK